MTKSTIDKLEVAKFAQHAKSWWDENGPLKTLHDINPVRLNYIQAVTSLQDKTILDVGCGGGILSEGLAKCGGIVTGLDVEEDAILSARMHATQNKLKITYECIPLESYKSKPFSIITCLEMLEHVQDPAYVIKQAARLLKPGGYLFLSTINRTLKAYASVVVAAEYVFNIIPRQTHDFQKFIKPSELACMLRDAGLELEGMSGISYNPFTREASLNDAVDVNYILHCKRL